MPSVSLRLRARRALAALALAAAAPFASGCNFAGDATAPAARPAAGRVAIAAQLVAATGTSALALRVTAAYLRASGEFVSIGTQDLALTDAGTQQVPVTIDLAACLNDPAHRGADQGRGADALCFVQLTVALLTGDRVLDVQTVGPLALRPGVTAVPDRPLALYAVSTVRVAPATGVAPADGVPYRLEIGQTLALAATVQDAGGQPVPDRPARWVSDAPTVARVDSGSGLVTAVTAGRARVTATAGGREASVDVQVVPATAAITVTAAGSGAGRVTSSPVGLDCRVTAGQATGTCTFAFPRDAAVTLTAVPDAGSSFATWGSDCAAAAGALTCTVTPNVPRAVVATFTAFRTLSVTLAGAGGGAVTSAPAGVACARASGVTTGTCSAPYLDATRVMLAATPDSASAFAGWSGLCSDAEPACAVTLDQARAITATFVRRTVNLTVALSGAGAGSVALGDTTVCTLGAGTGSASCTRQVPVFVPLTLTAAPGTASQFQGWAGACSGTGLCTLTPRGDVAIGAVFTPSPVGVTVSANGQSIGNGSVSSAPAGIACAVVGTTQSGTCTSPFAVGAAVTLNATPAAGFSFAGWAGACVAATGPVCTLTVGSTPLASTVRFAPTAAALTLAGDPAGTGTGQAFTTDERLSCTVDGATAQGQCSGTYTNLPATVVLRATTNAFNAFAGWSGVACAEGNVSDTCTITLVAGATARANFRRLPTVVVTPAAEGVGSGTLTVTSPVGFSCTLGVGGAASACQFAVPQNARVTLSVTPDVNTARFTYGGACDGETGTSCTFTASGSVNPVVTYLPRQFAVSVTRATSSTGVGEVSSGPPGVSCTVNPTATSGTCSAPFTAGTAVQLTATARAGSTFAGWGGACASAGTNVTCILPNLQAAAAVIAGFTNTSTVVSIIPGGLGSASVRVTSPFDTTCTVFATATGSQRCEFRVPRNATVSVTATVNAATTANLVYGGACATPNAAACTFIASADTTLGVNLAPLLTPASDATYGMLHGTLRIFDVGIPSVSAGSVVGNTAIVPPGASVRLTGTWEIGPVTDTTFCPGCIIQLYTAWIPNAAAHGAAPINQRFWEGQTPNPNPGPGERGTFDWTTRAPTTRGTYYVGITGSLLFSSSVDPSQQGDPGRPTANPNGPSAASFRIIVQ